MNILFKIMDLFIDLFMLIVSTIGFIFIICFIYKIQKNFSVKIIFPIIFSLFTACIFLCSFMKKEYRIVITETEIGNDKVNSRLEYSKLALIKFYNNLTDEQLNDANTILQNIINKRKGERK